MNVSAVLRVDFLDVIGYSPRYLFSSSGVRSRGANSLETFSRFSQLAVLAWSAVGYCSHTALRNAAVVRVLRTCSNAARARAAESLVSSERIALEVTSYEARASLVAVSATSSRRCGK